MDESIRAASGIPQRRRLFIDEDDLLVRLAGVAEGDYEVVTVRSSWPEKGLIEGDLVVVAESTVGASAGDIVLIESEGSTRLGLLASAGWLETPVGSRPLEASETIIGVGIALARKLRPGD